MKYLVSIVVVLLTVAAGAKETLISTGEVFDKEGKEKKFTYERYQWQDGNKVFDRAVHKNTDGEVLTEETMERVDGKVVNYEMQQKQLKQRAWIEVADGKVTFNLKKYRKRNYPQTTKLPDNFIMGLQIVPTIHSNWDKLMAGDDVEFKLGVWHRQEAIEFKLEKEKLEGNTFVVKMNPTSMFIRAVVNPLYFYFDKSSKNLTKYVGRTTPKEKRGKSYYDFDGLVKYTTVATLPGSKKEAKKPKKKAAPSKKKSDKKS